MSREHISHKDIVAFADSHVNLKQEDASKYREQVSRLRRDLERRLETDTDFKLKKMLLSGSLAKGTALKSINDIDVALYVQHENPPSEMPKFIDWLVDALRNLYPNMNPSQITPQQHSVCISFRGSGLDVDIVPISYNGNLEWDGCLYSVNTGEWVMTNISKHLEFIRKRKSAHPQHFAQIVRLLKFWVKEIKRKDDGFKFKSFLVELILAHISDSRTINLNDYVETLAEYFNFILTGGLDNIIVFNDYYSPGQVQNDHKPIRIFDPVNPENNAASNYLLTNKGAIVEAAMDAADALDAALYATTKGETMRYWQKIFGPAFGG